MDMGFAEMNEMFVLGLVFSAARTIGKVYDLMTDYISTKSHQHCLLNMTGKMALNTLSSKPSIMAIIFL